MINQLIIEAKQAYYGGRWIVGIRVSFEDVK